MQRGSKGQILLLLALSACGTEPVGLRVGSIADTGSDDAQAIIADVGSVAARENTVDFGSSADIPNGSVGARGSCSQGFVAVDVDGEMVCAPDYPIWGAVPEIPSGFTDNGNGTVAHALTGLIWQRDVDKWPDMTWVEANVYCRDLSLAGHDDWRLPTVAEGNSIAMLSWVPPHPAGFGPPHYKAHWSALRHASMLENAWQFGLGTCCQAANMSEPSYVRCVRAGTHTDASPQPPRFKSNALTVKDTVLGLNWQAVGSDIAVERSDAPAICDAAGSRLPTAPELYSLMDREREIPPRLVAPFSSKPPHLFWTSSWNSSSIVDFDRGIIFQADTVWEPMKAQVWCVKD